MFTCVAAKAYRSLKNVTVELGPYQVLVGPNASGKSTLLDVIGFLGDLLAGGPDRAINSRSENFHDLVWGREGSCFKLAVEARIPKSRRAPSRSDKLGTIRYETLIRIDNASGMVLVDREELTLRGPGLNTISILQSQNGHVTYFAEEGNSPPQEFTLGPQYFGFGSLPMDETKFPAAKWLKNILLDGVQIVVLDNQQLRASSPPGQSKGNARLFDGLNLPRWISRLTDSNKEEFNAWVRHIQTALPDIETVRTILRPEDKHRYLMVRYKNGIEVPAWMLSDGTLRLLALTLLAYAPEREGVYLVEEPEVGVHPSAFETIIQSLSSVYDGQVLITTHAPLLVGLTKPQDLLCFSKTDQGTEVTRGNQHPLLKSWQEGLEISDLFAAGVLG